MDALFPCRCRLDLDGVVVPTLLLDLVLILLSGSDLVFSEVLDPSVLALSLVLDLTLVVGLLGAAALILELVLVFLVFGAPALAFRPQLFGLCHLFVVH